MKNLLKKSLPLLLLVALVAMSGSVVSCNSRQLGTKPTDGTMYERQQSSRGSKVKSNIKVRGTNRTNGHTTRSY